MSSAASILRAQRRARNPFSTVDAAEVKHFVYRLHDEAGAVIYVGKSGDVPLRLQHHYYETQRGDEKAERKAAWFFRARSVSMVGPFTWDEALDRERAEIQAIQPVGNVSLTARDPRPLVAAQSLRAAETA